MSYHIIYHIISYNHKISGFPLHREWWPYF